MGAYRSRCATQIYDNLRFFSGHLAKAARRLEERDAYLRSEDSRPSKLAKAARRLEERDDRVELSTVGMDPLAKAARRLEERDPLLIAIYDEDLESWRRLLVALKNETDVHRAPRPELPCWRRLLVALKNETRRLRRPQDLTGLRLAKAARRLEERDNRRRQLHRSGTQLAKAARRLEERDGQGLDRPAVKPGWRRLLVALKNETSPTAPNA